jgi:hypothetical protein
MAQPLPNQPLLDVLAQYGLTKKELSAVLLDGAQEAERLIPKLVEKHTTSGTVKAAQLALVLRELKVAQSALWGDLGRVTTSGVEAGYLKAAEGAEDALLRVFKKFGVNREPYLSWFREQAKQGVANVLAKAKNGIPLSRAVYKTQALATGLVDRTVSRGLLLGHNAKDVAKSVRHLIDPNVAGGVSYAAFRLARTEINHAYQTSQAERYQGQPWIVGMKWNLSKSHPKPDICNKLVVRNAYNLGDGVYPVGKRPDSHPNCLCYQTPEDIGEDAFIDNFLAGDYNSYLDEQLYTYADRSTLLCP